LTVASCTAESPPRQVVTIAGPPGPCDADSPRRSPAHVASLTPAAPRPQVLDSKRPQLQDGYGLAPAEGGGPDVL
jgi:hypothetical protein